MNDRPVAEKEATTGMKEKSSRKRSEYITYEGSRLVSLVIAVCVRESRDMELFLASYMKNRRRRRTRI